MNIKEMSIWKAPKSQLKDTIPAQTQQEDARPMEKAAPVQGKKQSDDMPDHLMFIPNTADYERAKMIAAMTDEEYEDYLRKGLIACLRMGRLADKMYAKNSTAFNKRALETAWHHIHRFEYMLERARAGYRVFRYDSSLGQSERKAREKLTK